MLNIYDYPKIRDILMVWVGGISDGKPGYGILAPRSADAFKDLQRFLSMRNVEFDVVPGIGINNIVFRYGQDTEIDDTVQQMQYDSGIEEVNGILQMVRNYETDEATQAAIDELKKLITKVNKVQYEGEKEPSHYYFYFTDIERAYALMAELGIWVEKHTSHAGEKPVDVLRLPMANVGDWSKRIIEELKKAAEKKATGELYDEETKHRISELKKHIVWAEQSDPKIWRDKSESVVFTFNQGYAEPANYLFGVMGIKVLDVIHEKMVGGNVHIRCAYSKDDPIINAVYKELRKSAEEKRDKGRTPDEIAKGKALDQLKEMITDVKELMSGENHRRYFYFYFPADKISAAQELMEKVGVSCEQHLSNYEDQERMVLRCRSTMVSGDVARVIEQLQGAAMAKKVNGAAARRSQGNFEHGSDKVDDMVALETLKRLIKDIRRLPREQELATPGKLFYCFYFDADAMEKAQDLLSQMKILTEMKQDDKGQLYLLYSVKEGEMPDEIVDIIYALDSASANKKVNYEAQREAALAKLKKIVTDVKHARYKTKPEEYYYFYFPIGLIDEAQDLMTRFVGDIPEQHISHQGEPDEKVVLRYLIDDTSAVMGLIEELKRELKDAVQSRPKAQDRGMGM